MDGHSDGELLSQFLAQRDESAFEALVLRHGPMVWGVCRRILANAADAEDAFQVTFLVLVRKSAALVGRAVVGDWLHGVARRTALNARRMAAHRRAKEEAMARPEVPDESRRDDRLALLDAALSRLPEKYRLPIVLCDLEGHTRQEAAGRLGWREGTVAGRLARGRELLARWLVRQGLVVSAAALGTAFTASSAPAALVASTIRAATLVAAGQAAVAGAIPTHVVAHNGKGGAKHVADQDQDRCDSAVCVGRAGRGRLGQRLRLHGHREGICLRPAAERPKERQGASQTEVGAGSPRPAPVDRIKAGDILRIEVTGTKPDQDIDGVFQVDLSGNIALGFTYGQVKVQGLSLEDAEAAIDKHLKLFLKDHHVSVTRSIRAEDVRDLQRRVQQLEKEVQSLRSAVEELRKKPSGDK